MDAFFVMGNSTYYSTAVSRSMSVSKKHATAEELFYSATCRLDKEGTYTIVKYIGIEMQHHKASPGIQRK